MFLYLNIARATFSFVDFIAGKTIVKIDSKLGAQFMCDPLELDDPRDQHLMLLIW